MNNFSTLRRSILIAATTATVALLTPTVSSAADFPDRMVKFVVPNPPGGASDIIARLFSEKLAQTWGQPVLVENRPGAATVIGTDSVAKAPADGYTILVTTLTHSLNAAMKKSMPYDSVKDFTGVTLVSRSPIALVVNSSLPINNLSELIAYAKANPGKLSYASAGPGTIQHMAAEMLKSQANVDILHVPYKGSGAAHPDLLGGTVNIMFDTIAAIQPHIRSGKVRALAVGGTKRSALLPDVPTVSEAGLPDFNAGSWVGLLVRSGTPPENVAKLNKDIVNTINNPDVQARFAELGIEPVGSTANELQDLMAMETDRWGALIKSANISVE